MCFFDIRRGAKNTESSITGRSGRSREIEEGRSHSLNFFVLRVDSIRFNTFESDARLRDSKIFKSLPLRRTYDVRCNMASRTDYSIG